MNTFHRVGVGWSKQWARKTTPKKMAKSVVGKSILDRGQSMGGVAATSTKPVATTRLLADRSPRETGYCRTGQCRYRRCVMRLWDWIVVAVVGGGTLALVLTALGQRSPRHDLLRRRMSPPGAVADPDEDVRERPAHHKTRPR